MPRQLPAELIARNQRLAALAREEKAALAALDRATARVADARARRDSLVAGADEVVATAEAVRDAALGVYARVAGAERAALTLGEDVRELRRVARESASLAPRDGQAARSANTATRPDDAGRPRRPAEDSVG